MFGKQRKILNTRLEKQVMGTNLKPEREDYSPEKKGKEVSATKQDRVRSYEPENTFKSTTRPPNLLFLFLVSKASNVEQKR